MAMIEPKDAIDREYRRIPAITGKTREQIGRYATRIRGSVRASHVRVLTAERRERCRREADSS